MEENAFALVFLPVDKQPLVTAGQGRSILGMPLALSSLIILSVNGDSEFCSASPSGLCMALPVGQGLLYLPILDTHWASGSTGET